MASASPVKFHFAFRCYREYPEHLLCKHEQGAYNKAYHRLLDEQNAIIFNNGLAKVSVFDLNLEKPLPSTYEAPEREIVSLQTLLHFLQNPDDAPPRSSPTGSPSQSSNHTRNSISSAHKEVSGAIELKDMNGMSFANAANAAKLAKLAIPSDATQPRRSRDQELRDLDWKPYEELRMDPHCRFVFLSAPNQRAGLQISYPMMQLLATFHQVMPEIVDFISVFGSDPKNIASDISKAAQDHTKNEASDTSKAVRGQGRDQHLCSFNILKQLTNPAPSHLILEQLGRSGRFYQLCYNFMTPSESTLDSVKKGRTARTTVRQAIFHHQYDVVYGRAFWMSARALTGLKGETKRRDIEERIRQLWLPKAKASKSPLTKQDRFRLTLEVHVTHCYFGASGWRELIEVLEQKLDDLKERVEPITQSDGTGFHDNSLQTLRDVQITEENVVNSVLSMNLNIETLKSLKNFYQELSEFHADDMDFDDTAEKQWQNDVTRFGRKMDGFAADIRRIVMRAERLVQTSKDYKSLIITYLEWKDSARAEDLTSITVKLAILAQREAVAVRVLTIVALFYLPSTVVSGFFSTDVVKYQPEGGGDGEGGGGSITSYSGLAMERWLETALPITILTVLIALALYFWEMKKRTDEIKKMEQAATSERTERRDPESDSSKKENTTRKGADAEPLIHDV